jgi:hypothetical protein
MHEPTPRRKIPGDLIGYERVWANEDVMPVKGGENLGTFQFRPSLDKTCQV